MSTAKRLIAEAADDYHDKHLCNTCGYKFADHAGKGNPFAKENACPSGDFPKWPSSVGDEKKAGELYDKRIKDFWAKSPGIFKPK